MHVDRMCNQATRLGVHWTSLAPKLASLPTHIRFTPPPNNFASHWRKVTKMFGRKMARSHISTFSTFSSLNQLNIWRISLDCPWSRVSTVDDHWELLGLICFLAIFSVQRCHFSRDFPGGSLGLAWTASGENGGVCDTHRAQVEVTFPLIWFLFLWKHQECLYFLQPYSYLLANKSLNTGVVSLSRWEQHSLTSSPQCWIFQPKP